MAIGFVLAWIKGEGLQPSLVRSEFRRPKGHQQAQRSDIGRRVDGVWGVLIQRETLAPGGRVYYFCSAREICSAAAAMCPQLCVRRPQRCACALLLRVAPKGSS